MHGYSVANMYKHTAIMWWQECYIDKYNETMFTNCTWKLVTECNMIT